MVMKLFNFFPSRQSGCRSKAIGPDDKGTAMVEFAITLPVLLTLYLGCVQICDVVAVYRKTTTTAKTVVDLVSRETNVPDSVVQSYLDASSQVMAPYSTAKLRIVVTHLSIDNAGVARVDWSNKSGTGAVADTSGAVYTLPAGVGVNNTSILVARVSYAYLADIGGYLHTDIPLADTIYMYPRSIKSITRS
jgi:Flp pilus assembly protein TadG